MFVAVSLSTFAMHATALADAVTVRGTISVRGTLDEKPFAFECVDPGTNLGDDTVVSMLPNQVFVGCKDPASHLRVSASVLFGMKKSVPNADESMGRINVLVPDTPPDDAIFDIITTSKRSRDDATFATGTSRVKKWQPAKRHIIGESKMSWSKDKAGHAGNVTIAFDVTMPPAP